MMRALVVVVGCGSLTACLVERDYSVQRDPRPVSRATAPGSSTGQTNLDEQGQPWSDTNTTTRIEGGRVLGTIGSFDALDVSIPQPGLYVDSEWNYSHIELVGSDAQGRGVMIYMDLNNVDVGEMPQGATDCSDAQILVCNSDSYDAPPEECTITTADVDDGQNVLMTARIPSYDDNDNRNGTASVRASFHLVKQ